MTAAHAGCALETAVAETAAVETAAPENKKNIFFCIREAESTMIADIFQSVLQILNNILSTKIRRFCTRHCYFWH